MSSSNCCFLTYIQISQEAGQVVWYSHLFKNFPQFDVIHTAKSFSIINEAEVDVDVGNLISGCSAFSKSSLNICKFTVHVLLKPGLENKSRGMVKVETDFQKYLRLLDLHTGFAEGR